MANMKLIDHIVIWILIVGGLNWGTATFFGFDFVGMLATLLNFVLLNQIIKGAVFASALYAVFWWVKEHM